MAEYPDIKAPIVKEGVKDWQPYARDAERLARTWAIPGTKGLEHRIGGLEKDELKGSVSHDPVNHQKMVNLREEKVQRVDRVIPTLKVEGEESAKLLVVGWGGTYGHLATAVKQMQDKGHSISLAHFNYIKPLPTNVREVFGKYDKIVVCENNMGQFADYLRMTTPGFEYLQYNKVQGLPFTTIELENHFEKLLEE